MLWIVGTFHIAALSLKSKVPASVWWTRYLPGRHVGSNGLPCPERVASIWPDNLRGGPCYTGIIVFSSFNLPSLSLCCNWMVIHLLITWELKLAYPYFFLDDGMAGCIGGDADSCGG